MTGSTTRPRDVVPLPKARAICRPAIGDITGTDWWQFRLQPYLWLPAADISIDAVVPGLGGPVDTGPRSIGVDAETDPDDQPPFTLAANSIG